MGQKQSFYERWVQNWWSTELTAVLLSCGLTAALCAILRAYDNHPVPTFGTWFSTGITLAAIVSLLINLSVAASLAALQACISQLKWMWYNGRGRPLVDLDTFDGASRGLIGSLLLLWKLRLSPVASFGALLMATQLAVAPLTQQSVRQVLKQVPSDSEQATTSKRQSWNEDPQLTQVNTMPSGYTQLGSGMMGAIANGLFANAQTTINNTAPQCGSGNCTFPDYNSLAICYSVANVTSSVETKLVYPGGSVTEGCIREDFCLVHGDSHINITSAAPYSQASAAAIGTVPKPLNFSSASLLNDSATIADFYVLYLNHTLDKAGHPNIVYAVEFALSWCLQTFSTRVDKTVASTTQRLVENAKFTNTGGYIESKVDDVSYSIEIGTHSTLQRYFWLLLSGAVSEDWDGSESVTRADSSEVIVVATQFGAASGSLNVNDTQQDYMDRTSHLLGNMATSMTNYIRSSGDVVLGTAKIQQNYVQVSWAFLAAPVAFTVFCLLFCLGVILRASFHHDRNPPVWKSSTMAGLRSLDPQLYKSLGAMTLQGTMSKSAQDVKVYLDREGDGWRLTSDGQGHGAARYVALSERHGEVTE